MSLFTTLLLAHLLGDFPLQTDRIFALKLKGGIYLLPHVLVHVVITAILLRDLGEVWPLLLALGIFHFAIDWFKVTTTLVSPDIDFLIDQEKDCHRCFDRSKSLAKYFPSTVRCINFGSWSQQQELWYRQTL